MTESKVDFKSSVINEEFGFILYYLISKDDIFMADDFIDEYALRIRDMSISKNVKEIFKDCKNNCIFLILEYSDGVYHSYYEFKFFINTHKVYFNCYVKEAYENDDELILLDSYCFSFDDKFFNNLFNLPQIEEKTTSEPEQPAEDAEEQENPEQTPAEEKVQSTLKYVLSCNKTKLYNLVKAKSPFDLPKLRDTYYEHSKGMHWFTYTSKNSRYVKCSFGSSYGAFLLRVEAFEYDEVFELSFEDLLAFDLVKEVHEKNISEPEQPVEDAEEQDNPEQTPAEENKLSVELTLLERNLFEAHVKANDYYEQSIELGSEKFASSYLSQCDLLLKIIKESGLFSKYTVWLIQRNQETVGASY